MFPLSRSNETNSLSLSRKGNKGWGCTVGEERSARAVAYSTMFWYYILRKRITEKTLQKKHEKTLAKIFTRPVSGSIEWSDIEALFIALGAEVSEREGSRTGVFLFNEVQVFHRPHPSKDTNKGAVENIRKWLQSHGVKP